MDINFKNTDYYKRVISSIDNTKVYPVPYYVESDIYVTEENFSSLVDLEELKYKKDLKDLKDLKDINDFPIFNLRSVIEERIKPFIGSKLLILQYAYFNSDNINDGYKEIESYKNFNKWLIK